MKKILYLFHKIAEVGTLVSLIGMILAVTIQVVTRFLLPSAPSWTEELSRICFIYSVGFGVALAIKGDAFVRLELIKNYLPVNAYVQLNRGIHIIVIGFSLLLLYYSWKFVQLGMIERSPSLKIHMSVVFFSIVIMMFSVALFSFEQLFKSIWQKDKSI